MCGTLTSLLPDTVSAVKTKSFAWKQYGGSRYSKLTSTGVSLRPHGGNRRLSDDLLTLQSNIDELMASSALYDVFPSSSGTANFFFNRIKLCII